jgi:urease beta subunit
LKLKSKRVKDKNGKIISIEEFVYDEFYKIKRQDYKDEDGQLKFYKTFEYDENENCTKTVEYSGDHIIQVSFEYQYDNTNNQIKAIERTAEGDIWDWTEIIIKPNNNLKIWLAKDEGGNIIHKTVENLLDHSQQRFNSEGNLYELHLERYDHLNQLIEKLITDSNGNEKERHLFEYDGKKEIWQYIRKDSIVKTEESVYDDNKNLLYHIRKDNNGNCLEWYGFEYDKFKNKTKYFWGHEEGKQIGFLVFDLKYDSGN